MEVTRKKLTLPNLGQVSINFHGDFCECVISLYEKTNEFERQKDINHLGLIASELDGASHTRYEYVMLQCAVVDILDRLHKGNSSAQGSIKFRSAEFTGNSILKSWFLLSNFGHLKNTFGDEKALLLYIHKRVGFKTTILNKIDSKALRDWCSAVIDDFAYEKFHYVLSIYRTCKEVRNTAERDKLLLLYELLLVDIEELTAEVNKVKVHQLRELYKKIRSISIVAIDSYYSPTPLSIDLAAFLVSVDEIEGGVFGKNLDSSLTPFRLHLYEEIYLNPQALANQRSYEIQALESLSKLPRNPTSYGKIIKSALFDGLVKNHTKFLSPFCRLAIPESIQPQTPFINEFRNISLKTRKNCKGVEAYLDTNPYTNIRYADFFVTNNFKQDSLPKLLFNICSLISDQFDHCLRNMFEEYNSYLSELAEMAINSGIEQEIVDEILFNPTNVMIEKSWRTMSSTIFPYFQSLLWSVLRYVFKENYRIEIAPDTKPYPNFSLSFKALGDDYLMDTLEMAINAESHDEDRVHELKMLKKSANRFFDGYKIVCPVRIYIYDMTKPPEKTLVTDIDAVILKVSENKMSLELLEAKNNRKKLQRCSKATKDLRNNLVPVLNKGIRYRIQKSLNFGSKLVISYETKVAAN